MLSEAPHLAGATEEQTGIFCWRYEQFVQLGYSDTAAHVLADSDADLGVARRLCRRGCAAELALRILL